MEGVKDIPILPQGTLSNFCTNVPLSFKGGLVLFYFLELGENNAQSG